MINENIAKGQWKAVKGTIQRAWGRLTDDELDQTQGNLRQIEGLIQKRYGESQETVREKINSFIADLNESSNRENAPRSPRPDV